MHLWVQARQGRVTAESNDCVFLYINWVHSFWFDVYSIDPQFLQKIIAFAVIKDLSCEERAEKLRFKFLFFSFTDYITTCFDENDQCLLASALILRTGCSNIYWIKFRSDGQIYHWIIKFDI